MSKGRKHAKQKARVVARAKLPTRFGDFTILGVQGAHAADEMAVVQSGKLKRGVAPLVRIHSQCLTGDVLTSQRCDCRAQLEMSLRAIARARCGLLLYVPQEGRGIGLLNKLKAYEWQDRGMDTVEANLKLGFAADHRDYDFAASVLQALGARRIRLLSNNPEKVRQLEAAGIRVVERVPCQPRASRRTRAYLRTKKEKLGHWL
jgi:GTP cyclohydrolase II